MFRHQLAARHRTVALAAALYALGTGHAAANDLTSLPFEQLLTMEVYSASKFTQKASDAPALVTVISAAEIRQYGWRTLADVARSVRGLYVSYDRNYSYLGERGFLRPGDYNTRFLLLVDGNRINDAVYDQAPVGTEFPLDLELVERIEFVPGPGSSIYGSNAIFGVINVITKNAQVLSGGRAFAEAGGAGARRVGASYAWRSEGGTDVLLSGSVRDDAGRDLYYAEFDTPTQNKGIAQGLDYDRGERLLARIGNGALAITWMHARRVKGVPTAAFYQPFNDPRSSTTDRQNYLSASWHSATDVPEQLKARLYWGQYDSFGDYAVDNATSTLNHDGSAGRWWGGEVSLVSTRFAGHTILAGAELQSDYRLQQYNFDVAPFFTYLSDQRSARRAGVYLQDELALSAASRLNLGMRYDRPSGQPGGVSPRVALIHALSKATTIKAIHGLAFRAPNAFERFYAYPGPGGQAANPDLYKERIASTELAVVQQLDTSARLTATAFRNIVSRLITQEQFDADGTTRFENQAKIQARGAELEFEQRWENGAALRASYSYSHIANGGGQQLNAPSRLAKFNLTGPIGIANWQGAIEAQYVGPRQGLSGPVGGFWLANANLLTARLWGHTEASLSVYNLFGRRYADPGSTEHTQALIAQDGRALRLRVGHAF
ncbi:TonB-dependent receptor plug domain-containing protein [Massilia sp. CF038]|uniref:TonB-dependent receptor plug domain-containing protein n=1 Tax=Massilia sp. CF038 TaxID=1881045 RepID=UPI0035A36B40